MKTISAVIIDGVIYPVSEFPKDAIKIVFDGEKYIIYEVGDELPPEPVYDEQL